VRPRPRAGRAGRPAGPTQGHRRRNGHQRDPAPGPAAMAAKTDLAGRTFLLTGGNSGIGYATAADPARRGGRVHIPCRSPGRGGEAAVAAMAAQAGSDQVRCLHLDLADLGSVRHTTREFLALGEPLASRTVAEGQGCSPRYPPARLWDPWRPPGRCTEQADLRCRRLPSAPALSTAVGRRAARQEVGILFGGCVGDG
jgi:hypothetical protein